MRILRVYHTRCNELEDTSSFVVVPEGKTTKEADEDVYKAQNAYIAALEALRTSKPKPTIPNYYNNYDYLPETMTLKEVRALKEADKKAEAEYAKLERAASRSFEAYLCDLGYRLLSDLGDEDEGVMTSALDWGHRHGMYLQYGTLEQRPTRPLKQEADEETNDE